jgi:hypothetical protein
MPDILRINTSDWELFVWASDIRSKQVRFNKTLAARNAKVDGNAEEKAEAKAPQSSIRFKPAIDIENSSDEHYCLLSHRTDNISLYHALFFENTPYEFEFVFTDAGQVTQAEIRHPLQRINQGFHFSTRGGSAVLRGTVNTQNDVGWLRLPLRYQTHKEQRECLLSIEVFPTKMDMRTDLNILFRQIERHHPTSLFSVATTTEQELQRNNQRSDFPLLWLAHFKALYDQLDHALKRIINAPHSRLLVDNKQLKLDKLKGKLSPRLAERAREALENQNFDRRFRVEQKKLSVDTPENRFVKHVLVNSRHKLARIESQYKKSEARDKNPDKASSDQRLSDAFFDNLASYQSQLQGHLNQSLFKEIGEFKGLSKESLVLQQKNGYAAIYRIWQELKRYLDLLGQQSSISVKSMAELYEIWCFLEIDKILCALGFEHSSSTYSGPQQKRTAEGFGDVFHYKRDDITIRLAHEPEFSPKTKPILSWENKHRPDILLEATYANGDTIIWLFDAKYRIDKNDSEQQSAPDKVPIDALNQMHRYRDAIIYQYDSTLKERPVFGAFALYPGSFEQEAENSQDNPYHEAISAIGIGAFPLLPCADEGGCTSGNAWLYELLRDKFCSAAITHYGKHKPHERHYVEDSARIPYRGMKQVRYDDLTLITSSAQDERREDYYQQFTDGSASAFHMRHHASERLNITDNAIREVKYIVIASAESKSERIAYHRWPVLNVCLKKRRELNADITGELVAVNTSDNYWLFTLGVSQMLRTELKGFTENHHYLKMCPLNDLTDVINFDDVYGVYPWVT